MIKARITLPELVSYKQRNVKIVALSVAHAGFAALADQHVDCILIGDSLGMTVYGMENTIQVTMDMICAHTAALARVTHRPFLIADMPYASYHTTHQVAFENAVRLLRAGAQAVKLEVDESFCQVVEYLLARGVPVMAHVGLKPQFVLQVGNYRVTGRDRETYQKVTAQAEQFVRMGCFALLIEGVVESLATQISQRSTVPVIGIGASEACDGQILVAEDMLGLSDRLPKFAQQYASIGTDIERAYKAYAKDIRSGAFPSAEHTYNDT